MIVAAPNLSRGLASIGPLTPEDPLYQPFSDALSASGDSLTNILQVCYDGKTLVLRAEEMRLGDEEEPQLALCHIGYVSPQ